jgi:hypothetical protein
MDACEREKQRPAFKKAHPLPIPRITTDLDVVHDHVVVIARREQEVGRGVEGGRVDGRSGAVLFCFERERAGC